MWKDELPRRGLAWYGEFVRGKKSFLSPALLRDLYPRSGRPDDIEEGTFGPDAYRIARILLTSGPQPTAALREALDIEGRAGPSGSPKRSASSAVHSWSPTSARRRRSRLAERDPRAHDPRLHDPTQARPRAVPAPRRADLPRHHVGGTAQPLGERVPLGRHHGEGGVRGAGHTRRSRTRRSGLPAETHLIGVDCPSTPQGRAKTPPPQIRA